MEDDLRMRLDALEAKVDAAQKAAESTRKYLVWTGIVTIALIVVPSIGLLFAAPMMISNYTATFEQLDY